MNTVLRANGLTKRYGRRTALDDCTLEVPAGHVVGLVGPNGAGKSTLLNLAVGMLAPTSGTIEVLGGEPAAQPRAAGEGRVRRAGHADVRRHDRRRAPAARRGA